MKVLITGAHKADMCCTLVRTEAPDLPAAVPPGPDNPLGAFALDLSWTSTAIHGTNSPYGIGRRVSHGCFRLYPEDIAKLAVFLASSDADYINGASIVIGGGIMAK